MRTVSIISQKGGAGKTTLALNLAGASESAGFQTVVIDLDPQASAKGWHDHRNQEAPVVISAHASRLTEVIDTAKEHGADLCIIDTAPHSETTALAAAKAADLVLIPCRPAVFDLRAISSSVDLTQIAGKPALIVINAAPPRGPLAIRRRRRSRPMVSLLPRLISPSGLPLSTRSQEARPYWNTNPIAQPPTRLESCSWQHVIKMA